MSDTSHTPIPLLGYADKLSARPGEVVTFHVSSQLDQPFEASLVRVVCADPNPAGPGLIEQPAGDGLLGRYPSRPQPLRPGSYLRVDVAGLRLESGDFCWLLNCWPTTPERAQTLWCLYGDDGVLAQLDLDAGLLSVCYRDAERGPQTLTLAEPLKTRHWYRVWLNYDAAKSELCLGRARLERGRAGALAQTRVRAKPQLGVVRELCFAAATDGGRVSRHYNGKLESPRLYGRALSGQDFTGAPEDPLAHWDFSRDMASVRVSDLGPRACHGELVNFPARAMTGAGWDGSEMCWRHRPEHYGAVHFHDDDLYDAGWEADFGYRVADDLSSGLYAVRLRCNDFEDRIPFVVCPPRGERRARLCVLVSTLTYAVYGNHARPDFRPWWMDKSRAWGGYPWNPAQYPQYGLSTYNVHSDGSGICHASHRRPLLNLRPGYITYGYSACSGLRHLQADSHLLSWLEQRGIAYDLISDRELHEDGAEAVEGYAAVATGSHPEYHTPQTLNALQDYRDGGGNLLYLGGNGFYWRVALHPDEPHLIEIRRGEGGIRAWAAEPGEYYHAFDGGYGGLWRRNGRPPQQLAGVGFSAQGNFYGSYYRRTAASYQRRFDWMFSGIAGETLGDFGLSGGGAAGFEMDRADVRLGTPDDAVVVASSERHHGSFVLVPEEQLTHITNLPGEPAGQLLRADMLYHRNEAGGELFSVGSITFCGSLLCDGGENDVSTLLANVLDRFLA